MPSVSAAAIAQVGSVLGVALTVVLVGRAPTLGAFHSVFLWQLGFALATALLPSIPGGARHIVCTSRGA